VLLLFLTFQNSHPRNRVSLYLKGVHSLNHGHHSKPALSTLLRFKNTCKPVFTYSHVIGREVRTNAQTQTILLLTATSPNMETSTIHPMDRPFPFRSHPQGDHSPIPTLAISLRRLNALEVNIYKGKTYVHLAESRAMNLLSQEGKRSSDSNLAVPVRCDPPEHAVYIYPLLSDAKPALPPRNPARNISVRTPEPQHVGAHIAALEAQSAEVEEVEELSDDEDYVYWDCNDKVLEYDLDSDHADPSPELRWELCSNASVSESDNSTLSADDISDLIKDHEFTQAATSHLSPIDIEGLIASPGHIEDPDNYSLKSPAQMFYFEPHQPHQKCSCHWCQVYYFPTNENMVGKHDPSPWCQCIMCMIFRAQENRRRQDRAWDRYVAERNALEEKMRQKARPESQVQQEKDEIRNKRLGKLRGEIGEARDEEERSFVDLMDYENGQKNDAFDAGAKDWTLHKIWAKVKGALRSPESPTESILMIPIPRT
jgi:hypothetical protein